MDKVKGYEQGKTDPRSVFLRWDALYIWALISTPSGQVFTSGETQFDPESIADTGLRGPLMTMVKTEIMYAHGQIS